MLFGDQACVVLGPGDEELRWSEAWSGDDDQLARAHGGYVVQVDSDPPHIFSDFRVQSDPATGRPLPFTRQTADYQAAALADEVIRRLQADPEVTIDRCAAAVIAAQGCDVALWPMVCEQAATRLAGVTQ